MMSTRQRIVSIDDEDHILALVRAVLSDDFEVTTFNDTSIALESIPNLKPDLILCDVNMPERDGFEIHQTLREIPALRAVPFIYLTGLMDKENFRKGMNQGADDYLTKPFTPAELKEAIRVRLERTEGLRDSELTIISLGSVGVRVEGRMLEYEAKKVMELFLYLITHGGSVVWLDLFNDLWWEDVNDNAIHVVLTRARKTFEGLAEFVLEKETLQLHMDRPYQWDAQMFETEAKAALEQKDLNGIEKSIQLYKGSFLKDFDSPWSNKRRDDYEDLYVRLLGTSLELANNELQQQAAQKRLDDFLKEE
jgi:two-component SAPR family response regulator